VTGQSPSSGGRSRRARFVSGIHRAIPFKNRIYDPLRRALPRGLKRRLRPVRFQGIFTVHVDAAHSFTLESTGSRVENDLYWRGYGLGWEGMSLQIWRYLVPQASSIFDIGASTGIYALAAKAINPEAVVAAFEPLERHFKWLQANLELNDLEILAEQRAVSDVTGTATMFDVTAQHGMSSLEARPGLEAIETTVDTVRLDDYAAEHRIGSVDLIKLDIEGHEPQALRGLAGTLQRHRPWVLAEFNPRCLRGHGGTDPLDFAGQLFRLSSHLTAIRLDGREASLDGPAALLGLWEQCDREAVDGGRLPRGMAHLDVLFRVAPPDA